MVKVLLVDDYAPLREAAVVVLKSNGFEEVFQTGSPDEGVELFRKHKPGLVILDMIMPKKKGVDLVEEIKRIDPETKVVMLTVLNGEAPRQESFKKGVDLYLIKPLTSEKVDKIKRMLGLKS